MKVKRPTVTKKCLSWLIDLIRNQYGIIRSDYGEKEENVTKRTDKKSWKERPEIIKEMIENFKQGNDRMQLITFVGLSHARFVIIEYSPVLFNVMSSWQLMLIDHHLIELDANSLIAACFRQMAESIGLLTTSSFAYFDRTRSLEDNLGQAGGLPRVEYIKKPHGAIVTSSRVRQTLPQPQPNPNPNLNRNR